jgi:purine-binding chemotaxis protein CheW
LRPPSAMENRMTASRDFQPLVVLTLALQGELFAIEAARVREILDLVAITDVPGADRFVNGLINVRGRVVPLADLRLRFAMEQRPPTIDTRIVVIEIDVDGDPMIVGIRADKVYGVTELAPSALEETPRIGLRWRPEFISCIGKRDGDFIAVLDIGRVFSQAAMPDMAVDGKLPLSTASG